MTSMTEDVIKIHVDRAIRELLQDMITAMWIRDADDNPLVENAWHLWTPQDVKKFAAERGIDLDDDE